MFPLVEFPELVQHYAPFFKDVFSAEAFIEFQRYISGLIVSENKTVDGMNRLFVIESRNLATPQFDKKELTDTGTGLK